MVRTRTSRRGRRSIRSKTGGRRRTRTHTVRAHKAKTVGGRRRTRTRTVRSRRHRGGSAAAAADSRRFWGF